VSEKREWTEVDTNGEAVGRSAKADAAEADFGDDDLNLEDFIDQKDKDISGGPDQGWSSMTDEQKMQQEKEIKK
jgi:hypothetical protein